MGTEFTPACAICAINCVLILIPEAMGPRSMQRAGLFYRQSSTCEAGDATEAYLTQRRCSRAHCDPPLLCRAIIYRLHTMKQPILLLNPKSHF
jgi:hypothetical protein